MASQPQAGVDAGIDGWVHVGPGVLHYYESCRDGEVAEQQVVLQVGADVGAVQAERVVAVGAVDVVGPHERFAEVAAQQVLVAYLGTEGCASCLPVEVAV